MMILGRKKIVKIVERKMVKEVIVVVCAVSFKGKVLLLDFAGM